MPDDERHPVRVHIVYDDGEEDVIDPFDPDGVLLVTGPEMRLDHESIHANGTMVLTIKPTDP